MDKKIKDLGGSKIELEVKLTDPEFQSYYQPVYDEAIAQVDLKGFRKGTAPKDLADAAINKEKVFNAAVEEAVRFTLDEVKTGKNWTLIDQPRIEVTNAGPGLTYKATLTLFPEVELPNYQKIAKDIFSKEIKVEVSDEELDKTTNWILNSRASETRVDRKSKGGDLMEIDLDAFHEGKPIENSSFKKEKFILGESKFIPGFDKELSDRQEGDEFNFKLQAPVDYWQKDFQGKDLEFKGKVHSVFERTVPELDDDFAKTLGPNFQGVSDLHKSMKEGLEAEKKNKEIEKQRIEVLKRIAEGSKIDIPEVLIERTLDSLVEDVLKNMGPEATKNQDETKLKNQLREQLRKRAEENVASHLVIYKLAQVESLEPTKEEVAAQAAMYGIDPDKEGGYLYDSLQTQKVFAFLEGKVKPVEKEGVRPPAFKGSDPLAKKVEETEKKEDN